MQQYKRDFLELALAHKALQFGEFELKSGRISPYFFNLGAIATGAGMARLARCYARALRNAAIGYDALFGPAYKGIPLVTATACALADNGGDVPFAYNRKETKDHGEGGRLVGADLTGRRVVIVDDVITAGTAVREAVAIIGAAGGQATGLLVALDRQERGEGEVSAIRALANDCGIATAAVCGLDDIVSYLSERGHDTEVLAAMADYRSRYGI